MGTMNGQTIVVILVLLLLLALAIRKIRHDRNQGNGCCGGGCQGCDNKECHKRR